MAVAPAASATPAWEALGSGVDGEVLAVTATPAGIFAGGSFASAGGAPASRVARWDGTAWSAVGSGVSSTVTALAGTEDAVYIGGGFTALGGDGSGASAKRIARWDGTALSPVGAPVAPQAPGMNGWVYAVAEGPDGFVYVGGSFNEADGVAGRAKAVQWTGSAWVAMPGLTAAVQDLEVAPNGHVFAATYDGGINEGGVWEWDGTSWTQIGMGFDNVVEDVEIAPDGKLYAGGWFDFLTDGTTYVKTVAVWNPSLLTWSSVGSVALDGYAKTLAFDAAGRLFAGGEFLHADPAGPYVRRLAMWDGGAWTEVAGGVDDGVVDAIDLDPSGRLIAGGSFTGVGGGTTANRIATVIAGTPQAPTAPTATAGNARATVSWTGVPGAAPLTYTVTATPGGRTCEVDAPATACVVTGLVNGRGHTFAVTAANDAATSASVSTASVTPRPPAPTLGSARVSGKALVAAVTMRSAGVVTLAVRRKAGGRWKTACTTASTTVAAAGDVTVRCAFNRLTLAAMRTARVQLAWTLTATPTGGLAVTGGGLLRAAKLRR